MRVNLTVNGNAVTADVEPRMQLADFLRDHLLLSGTHIGCEHGVCGACTVLLDGAPARSCIAYAAACERADVCTIEGLEDDPAMQRLRVAFTAEHALQCGYCTPGMLVTARDIVLRLPDADAARIRLELAGNLCRCTGYVGIVRAIERVLREGRSDAEQIVPRTQVITDTDAIIGTNAAIEADIGTPAAARDPTAPTLTLSIRIERPRAELWAALHDPAMLATCVPGARLTTATGGNIEGEMQVALGPITALFVGSGRLELDDPAQRATLSGEGNDRRSGTRLSGTAIVTLSETGATATDATLVVTYALRGPLAQLARGPIVQAFAADVAETVARNLERRLAGDAAAAPPAHLSVGGMLARIVWQRLRRWLHLR
jgi:carbon-monoxide dehydrogenase small subunit